jgi:hypothetical protein
LKRILVTALVVILGLGPAYAQNSVSASLTVNSTPPGAEFTLDGDATLSGITPAALTYPLIGEYSLTVTRHGYEKYRTRLVLDPSKPLQVDVDLSPRTGSKAALRSFFLPGWGQFYTEQKTKGFVFSLLFTGALLFYSSEHDDFKSKEDDYLRQLDEYDEALAQGSSYDELTHLHQRLITAQEDAYDAESDRRVAAGAVIGVWGLSVLDALLFSPSDPGTFSVKGVDIAPSAGADGVGLTLTKAF